MPRNPESDARKKYLAKLLESRIGELDRPHPSRPDWYSSIDGIIHVFFTDSKPHFDRRPWFDMKLSDIYELANQDAGFVIFVLGDKDNFLVIPATSLRAKLENYRPGPQAMAEGRYHFNLHGRTFEQLKDWDLKPYAQNWELIPARPKNPN